MENNIEQILRHHLIAFGNNDLDAILEDYTADSVIFTPKGLVKGLADIRQFFEDFFAAIPTGSAFGMDQKAIVGNVAYIVWNSNSDVAEIPVGTDTFVFEGGKIQYHTVADYRISK